MSLKKNALNLVYAGTLLTYSWRLYLPIKYRIRTIMARKGKPIARNRVLDTIPNTTAVICSKIRVTPTSKSAVILLSMCSIFL